MNKKWDGVERRKSLRAQAEAMVAGISAKNASAQPAEILLHELLVHKVELEMQNEELKLVHISLEEAKDQYVDFYEFAPIGYISVNREGLIVQINLTGAALLGVERSRLINRRFMHFVAPEEKDRWSRLFLNAVEHPNDDRHAFAMLMSRDAGETFSGYLVCQRRQIANAPPQWRIALFDVSSLSD